MLSTQQFDALLLLHSFHFFEKSMTAVPSFKSSVIDVLAGMTALGNKFVTAHLSQDTLTFAE